MKLIATDLDGTLLNEAGKISEENVEAIRKAQQQGIEVVIATGRAYLSARGLLQSVGLACPIISLNGADIRSEDEIERMSFPLDSEQHRSIQSICQREDLYFEVYTNHGIYADSKERAIQVILDIMQTANPGFKEVSAKQLIEQRVEEEEFKFITHYEDLYSIKDLEVYKILSFSHDQNQLLHIREELEKVPKLAITASGRENLEFNHVDAQKGTALQRLAKERGIKMEEVMAVGDNFNDASMLKVAGKGVAMGNAEEEIKKLSNFITKTNREHGVAYAIESVLE